MKRFLCILLCLALTAALAVPAAAAELTLSAPSAILMEKETGTVLYAKDEHTQLQPASVTKVMTLLLVMEAIDSGTLAWDDTITASAHACSMGGSQIWLKENEQMSVEDMVKAVCVVSANDCAVALAETVGGSEEHFVELMNQRAAELGKRALRLDCARDSAFLNDYYEKRGFRRVGECCEEPYYQGVLRQLRLDGASVGNS